MSEVTINYKDAAIATMDASGTKTLQTQGKYCEADIEVVYARPSGGGGVDYLAQRLNNTLVSYESDFVTSLPDYAFYNCSALTSLTVHNVTSVGSFAIRGTHIVNLALPNINGGPNWWQIFANAQFLEKVDVNAPPSFWSGTFSTCPAFNTLIIRKNDGVVPLNNINVFNGTPFASGGTGGTLYVDSSQVSQYTQAANWSTILGYANNQIVSIEGSPYENYYADGTPIT